MEPRRKFYIDPEIQFPLILSLILIVTIEGLFVGWGFSRAFAIAKEWDRPDHVSAFFKVLLGTIIPVVAVNFLLGTWLSHKIAGPLAQMRQAMIEIARGNLEQDIRLRKGDFLQTYAQEFNLMAQTLRRLIYRDHGYAADTDRLLSDCRAWLSRQHKLPSTAEEELNKLINQAKSRLSIINAHFLKGRKETP